MAYNKAVLVGNITKELDLRATQSGKYVCSFTIAVNRRRQDVTDFHNCVAWERTAQNIAKYFSKGQEILVEGELQNRDYTDKNGNKRYVTELIVDNFAFTGRKEASTTSFVETEEDDELPF